MTTDLLTDPFHCFALAAYVIVAAESGQWPPDSEATRRLAYELLEKGKKSADYLGLNDQGDA